MYKKIIRNIIKNNKKPIPYSKYLKNEDKRNKKARIKIITNWYRYIQK